MSCARNTCTCILHVYTTSAGSSEGGIEYCVRKLSREVGFRVHIHHSLYDLQRKYTSLNGTAYTIQDTVASALILTSLMDFAILTVAMM